MPENTSDSTESTESTQATPPPEATHTTAEDRYEGATPPGYDWPTHGGYLGCLLSVMFACLLAPVGYAVFWALASLLYSAPAGLGYIMAALITIVAYIAVFFGLARLGWRLGKRFLREYPQPSRPVWGEDDEEEAGAVIDTTAVVHDKGEPGDTTASASQNSPESSDPIPGQRQGADSH